MSGVKNFVTTIPLKNGTRNRLAGLCGKLKSYDDFLNELMDKYEKGCKEVS
jgi:hypothetical protein